MRKPIKMLALPMLTLTLLAGCNGGGGGDNSGGGDGGGAGGSVNFMVYQPSDQDDQNALQDLMKQFTAETGISVRLQPTPKDNYDEGFRSAITRGRYKPDLAYMDQPLIATYADSGMLTDLGPYIEEYGIDTSIYNEAAMSTNIYQGKTYGLPLNVTASVLFYNADIVSEDEVPETWDDWLSVSVTDDVALFEGIGNEGYAGWYFQAFLENAGGHLYNADTNTVAFDSPEGVKAAQFIKDLYRFDHPDDITIRASSNAFANGQIAFKIGSSYDIDNLFKQKPNFNLGVAVMPGNNGTHYSCMGGENLVIPSTAGNPEGAMKLLEFLNREENMKLLGDFTGNFPAITEYQDTDNPYKQVVLEQLETVVARPIVPGWIQINDIYLGAALDQILNYENPGDIEDRLSWAAEASNQVLAENV